MRKAPCRRRLCKHGASTGQAQSKRKPGNEKNITEQTVTVNGTHAKHSDQTEPDHLSYALCAIEGAHNALLDLEELEEKDLTRFRRQYENLAKEARTAPREGGSDTNSPFVANREVADEK